ncbi:MAG: PTS fructose transporter subunit IIC [Mycoplasma sp.]|nr:PTS fructose transporter subunit IIC [Mycoplasma sp.]
MNKPINLIAITACPTGVAHTFMAAKAIEREAKKRNIIVKIQKNGQAGIIDQLNEQDIKNADYVLICADVAVDDSPFKDKKVFKFSAKQALRDINLIFDQVLNSKLETKKSKKFNFSVYSNILNGISYMLPFVIAGGILVALSFFWGIKSFDTKDGTYNKFAHSLKTIGDAAMVLMLPILGGYIAYSIGNRPALLPGFVGGYLAANGFASLTNEINNQDVIYNSGFLGAIIAGILAGYLIVVFQKIFVFIPEKLDSIKPMLIYPIFSSIIVGLLVIWVINFPLGYVQFWLNSFLNWLKSENKDATNLLSNLILGIILGSFIAFDLGGPINKIAYMFGVADLATSIKNDEASSIMAAICVACMIPTLVSFFAVLFFPKSFDKELKQTGYTNAFLGLTMISEGAIPFAAKKPQYIIPIFMIACSIGTSMSLMFGASVSAPHGGILIVGLVKKWYFWLLSIFISSIIGGVCLGLMFKFLKLDQIKLNTK